MLFNPTKFVVLEEIRQTVEFVNRTIEKELSMQQLSNFAKWDFHFVEDITDEIDITIDFNRALKIVVKEYPELDFNHWRTSGKITFDGEGVWFSDGNSWQLDEALDDETAQPLYDELTNHVNLESVFDATQDVGIVDLQDYYEHVVQPIVEEFNIELDFSFLATDVAQELTQVQVITVLKEVNSIDKSNSETVTLHRLREKYKKSKTLTGLSFLVDEDIEVIRYKVDAKIFFEQLPIDPQMYDEFVFKDSTISMQNGGSTRMWRDKQGNLVWMSMGQGWSDQEPTTIYNEDHAIDIIWNRRKDINAKLKRMSEYLYNY